MFDEAHPSPPPTASAELSCPTPAPRQLPGTPSWADGPDRSSKFALATLVAVLPRRGSPMCTRPADPHHVLKLTRMNLLPLRIYVSRRFPTRSISPLTGCDPVASTRVHVTVPPPTPQNCQLAQVTSQSHIVDARSLTRRAEQGFSGLSTRPEERSRDGDRGRLSGQGWRFYHMGTASSDARRRTHPSRVGQDQRAAGALDQHG